MANILLKEMLRAGKIQPQLNVCLFKYPDGHEKDDYYFSLLLLSNFIISKEDVSVVFYLRRWGVGDHFSVTTSLSRGHHMSYTQTAEGGLRTKKGNRTDPRTKIAYLTTIWWD